MLLQVSSFSLYLHPWEALDCFETAEAVKEDVGNGQHFQHFPERRQYWQLCLETAQLDYFIIARS